MLDPRQIDPVLRKKYDVRGPRYTSYPPANRFKPVDSDQLFDRWRERNNCTDDPGISLYFHIPFCRNRCLFCGCHTLPTRDPERVKIYLNTLRKEMELAAEIIDPSRPVRQVAMGGGTPNFLSVDQLNKLLDSLYDTWQIAPGAELSAELDPRTSTPEQLELFTKRGFNRFSIGVQDFSDQVLERIRRGQSTMRIGEVVSSLRSLGCKSINFDLIYGLPGQTLETFSEMADRIEELLPDRIALYSYAHVPWIQPHQKALEKFGLPEPDLKASFFLTMWDRLTQMGYIPIGMDHFARPEDSLAQAVATKTLRRNFMGYTTGRGLDLIGFGASAISSVGSSYSQNEKEFKNYLEPIEQGKLPLLRGYLLNQDDIIRRELLLELFCNFRIDLKQLGKLFSIDGEEYFSRELQLLQDMEQDGLVKLEPGRVEVTTLGTFFIRNICMVFDRFLEQDPSARVYSRTV